MRLYVNWKGLLGQLLWAAPMCALASLSTSWNDLSSRRQPVSLQAVIDNLNWMYVAPLPMLVVYWVVVSPLIRAWLEVRRMGRAGSKAGSKPAGE